MKKKTNISTLIYEIVNVLMHHEIYTINKITIFQREKKVNKYTTGTNMKGKRKINKRKRIPKL